ncbi:MAG: Ig-like domain-containing protein [Planctomycetota bacterium]|jgi:hypothetical protein
MRAGRLSATVLWAVLPWFGGCARVPAKPLALAIEHTSPELARAASPLLLNDSITVYFTAPLLPLSVTTESFTVLDQAGHQVPGTLRTGTNWVTYSPDPPLQPSLDDGSFHPGATYQLHIAGNPRPDAIRSLDGARLRTSTVYEFRVAATTDHPNGLPAPLRPPGDDVPFVLKEPDLTLQLAADSPKLLLHFTQPVLPTSVRTEAFEVLLQRSTPAALLPRRVRVVTSRLDHLPGCTIEIDLGAVPTFVAGGERTSLVAGDHVCVSLRRDRNSLVDYAGNPPLAATPQIWSVVRGSSIALAEWPGPGDELDDPTGLSAGFEIDRGVVRPRVRLEAGDGSLGVFRPRQDTHLVPGVPFDRGDGVLVQSADTTFPFLAIDIPKGVNVTVDGASGAHLLTLGDIRIAGVLRLQGSGFPLPGSLGLPIPGRDLLSLAPVALFAAGDVVIEGAVEVDAAVGDGQVPLWIGAADQLHLFGPVPFQTLLVVEADTQRDAPRVFGSRGQSIIRLGAFRYGCKAPELRVRAETPWRQMPRDHDRGVLQFDVDEGLAVAWQATTPDPARPSLPNRAFGSAGRWQTSLDHAVVAVPGGHFVRLELTALLAAGRPVPSARELRLCDR